MSLCRWRLHVFFGKQPLPQPQTNNSSTGEALPRIERLCMSLAESPELAKWGSVEIKGKIASEVSREVTPRDGHKVIRVQAELTKGCWEIFEPGRHQVEEESCQMGIALVHWLRDNKKAIEVHIVYFKMMETENNSQQENIIQRQEAKKNSG
ncbi:hypothetical protein H920_17394 [Fukomys damarensis]|uniref:Uncharacterized protein n=1 Tax=Fukomys damarensis TaxID=885580 RepID=A0A091CSF3_FUKDA|nr:hypothetical protein H920_17394 [Fukomys damarensis]